MVTVTASTDSLPFPAVITSSPHWAAPAPLLYCACCCKANAGTPLGTVTTIWLSLQLLIGALMPPIVTVDSVLQVALPVLGEVHRLPKPKWRLIFFKLKGLLVACGPEYP